MSDVRQTEPANFIPHDELSRARRKVAALKGLYIHGSIFAVVMIALFFVDLLSGSDWWIQWVLIGWGIGVASHAVAVYFDVSNHVAAWEERKLDEILQSQPRPR